MKLLRPSIMLALFLIAVPSLAMSAGTGPRCEKSYSAYDEAPGPKAFATGRTKGCGYAYGRANIAAARKAALNFCQGYGGDACRVIESSQ